MDWLSPCAGKWAAIGVVPSHYRDPSQLQQQQKPRLIQYPAPWANKRCWNMKIFSWAEVPGKAVMLLLKPELVFPYWAALNQVGSPWVDQQCLVWCCTGSLKPRAGRDHLARSHKVSEMFPQSKLKVLKKKQTTKNNKKTITAYFTVGQLKCFNCFTWFFFELSFPSEIWAIPNWTAFFSHFQDV